MTTVTPVGRLTPVSARDVWANESADFTPWLLDNPDVLADVLGFPVAMERAEERVGGFSLDLIGRDSDTGDRLIVENQLETSDHTHLGQIMTYAGGTDPVNVVWVAPKFRDEHRAALEWLNERTDERTRFFAVQIELVRIDDSVPAPLLTLVVRPNDWGKRVRAAAAPNQRWRRPDFEHALSEVASPEVCAAARTLLEAHEAAGGRIYWGEGKRPSTTAIVDRDGIRIHPWSFYVEGAPGGGPAWAFNLDWLHKQGRAVPDERVASLVNELSALPGIAERCVGARDVAWKKRPSIPAAELFADSDAARKISGAFDRLYSELTATPGA